MVDARFYRSTGETRISSLLAKVGRPELWTDRAQHDRSISGVSELDTAGQADLGFATSIEFADALSATRAAVVVVAPALRDAVPKTATAIVTDSAHLVFTEISSKLYPAALQAWVTGGGSPPRIENGAMLGANVSVGAGADIGEGTVIGANTVIGPGVAIGRNCIIGANCTIEYSYLGNNVVILPGARLGVSGFGHLPTGGAIRSIPQLGRTIVQDNVEIGANSVVDRGALGDTVIGEGTKIGDLVVIAHNCRIGRNCMIIGFVGIAGSVVLEDNVVIAGGSGVAGHITLGAGTVAIAATWVSKSFPPGSRIGGSPARDVKTYWKELATLRRIAKGTKR